MTTREGHAGIPFECDCCGGLAGQRSGYAIIGDKAVRVCLGCLEPAHRNGTPQKREADHEDVEWVGRRNG